MGTRIHYAWIVLLLSFFGVLAVQGVRLSFGAYIEPWEAEFAANRGQISLISAVSFIVYGLTVPVFGRLVDRFGVVRVFAPCILLTGLSTICTAFAGETWHLMLLYGIISSVGFGGASGVVATVAVTNWFARKRGFAYGVLEAGFAAGQMIIVPVSLFLIHGLGWQQAVLITGTFLIAVVFPIILLFLKDRPADKQAQPLGAEDVSPSQEAAAESETAGSVPPASDDAPAGGRRPMAALKSRIFWFLFLPFVICGYTTTGLMDTHLIPYSHGIGHSVEVTGIAVGLLAAFNIVGCVLSGFLSDRWNPALLLAVLYAARAVSMVILLFAAEPVWLIVFAVLFGLADFATVAPTTLIASRHFRTHSLGLIIGIITLGHQIGSALGAYVPGLMHTWTGSYFDAFVIAIILLAIASMLSASIRPAKAS